VAVKWVGGGTALLVAMIPFPQWFGSLTL
jgi:hypothetical protein